MRLQNSSLRLGVNFESAKDLRIIASVPVVFSLATQGREGYVLLVRAPSSITEADILNDVIAPDQPGFSAEAAKSLLSLRFSERAQARIRKLLHAKNQGVLTAAEDEDLQKYLRVGQLVDLLQAKARLSL